MTDRYVFVKLLDAHVAARAEIAAHLRAALAGAPGVVAVTAGTPADASARSWDVSLVVRCPDLATLDAVLASPAARHLLDEWLPARAAVVKGWSFDVA